ncbi:hypothetical protein BS47DRAFT_1345755 [Hydnum rufescens UP504]|uniref:Uncharacterized protein n=1 Tax=Hydnum rufescens UP504 TaxID=1448309 RepID=A0A9P6AUE4_9AGAM|nr:hypothetical protein BS47DRAFT_1345755 [Hydnum rufescens UP504]
MNRNTVICFRRSAAPLVASRNLAPTLCIVRRPAVACADHSHPSPRYYVTEPPKNGAEQGSKGGNNWLPITLVGVAAGGGYYYYAQYGSPLHVKPERETKDSGPHIESEARAAANRMEAKTASVVGRSGETANRWKSDTERKAAELREAASSQLGRAQAAGSEVRNSAVEHAQDAKRNLVSDIDKVKNMTSDKKAESWWWNWGKGSSPRP